MGDIASAGNFVQRFEDIYKETEREVTGLTLQQLDFMSEKWDWSKWSIRRQLGHMPLVGVAWMYRRWNAELPMTGVIPFFKDYYAKAPGEQHAYVNALDAKGLLAFFKKGVDFDIFVVKRETPETMRSTWLTIDSTGFMGQVKAAHPTGIEDDPSNPGKWRINFEATFRHVYYELTTHFYNIQRLKRAQGLKTVTKTPLEGYHTLPAWDASEP